MKYTNNLMLLLSAIIWGTSFIATKSGAESLGSFAFNWVRSLISGLALLPVVYLLRSSGQEAAMEHKQKDLWIGGGFCGLALFAAGAFQQVGILRTTAGKAGFITALYVVLVPVLQICYKKRVGVKIWVCVISALVGFCLLCSPEMGQIRKGDLLVFCGAVCFAIHILVIEHYANKTDSIQLSCVQFFSCGLFAFIGTVTLDPVLGFEALTMEKVIDCAIPLLYSGVLSCSVAYTLQVIAQKKTESVFASLILSLESVFAVISGMLFFGERMTWLEAVGCAVIFGSVIAAQLFSQEKSLS